MLLLTKLVHNNKKAYKNVFVCKKIYIYKQMCKKLHIHKINTYIKNINQYTLP